MVMAKTKTQYVCQSCGRTAVRMMGRCPQCGEYNTMVEEIVQAEPKARGLSGLGTPSTPKRLSEIGDEAGVRLPLSIEEFARVLGGGVIPGSVVLIGGDPGIGKTTLLLQALPRLASDGQRGLYVSGGESPGQIKMRGERLGVRSPLLYILAETSLEEILKAVQALQPAAVAVDSIQ